MRTILLGICFILSLVVKAQRECSTTDYINILKSTSPIFQKKLLEIESFLLQQAEMPRTLDDNVVNSLPVIRIPVVVHVVYHSPEQNISDAQIISQVNALNRDFRRQNEDSVLTPERFRSLAADVQVEFVLASADPEGRPTNGIVRRFTSQTVFKTDDKIKYNESGGSNAWDPQSYLNIWVGKFQSVIGYSTIPGSPLESDGIVVSTQAFGTLNTAAPYDRGRTAVHEAGHWLGLKHIWGDQYCGDDAVGDTPPQGNFTAGCPSTFRTSCSNGSTGDMYMNYMDYTSDACVNLFTSGQKDRMRMMFAPGGPRYSILFSKGLSQPWNFSPLPIDTEENLSGTIYPNPARSEITIDVSEKWIGSRLGIADMNGKIVSVFTVTSLQQKINLAFLAPGIYFITGDKTGSAIRKKLIKL